MDDMNQSVAFFSLHTHILPFTEAEVLVGDVLQSVGVRPLFLTPARCTCGLPGNLSQRTPASATHCAKCAAQFSLLGTTLTGWDLMCLERFSGVGDYVEVDASLEALTPENCKEFYFRGIAVGQACIHDVVLEFKIDDIDFCRRPEIFHNYVETLRAAMLVLIWMGRMHDKFHPSSVVTYNSNYSLNRVVSLDCERRGVPHYSMHGGASLRYVWDTLMLTKGAIEGYRTACVANWESGMKDRVLNPGEVGKVAEHFQELFSGKKAHAYSAAAGSSDPCTLVPGADLDTPPERTLLLCLSSSDERVAVEQSGIRPVFPAEDFVFPQSYDLLGFLIDKVSRENGMRLIIRVHPRDFPNKREPRTSDNGRRLKKLLENLPSNVAVNWPEQKVSYYDLLQHVDLVVTAWSTVLLEASVFGCPIVLPFNPTRYYDACADVLSHDKVSYWDAIMEQSARPWTLRRAVRTFRWYWMVQFGGAVSLESSESRTCTLQEWLLRGFDWASKTLFMGRPPYSLPSAGFQGGFKSLMQRRINPRGAQALAATLKGEFNPMEDFSELQRRQGLRDGFAGGPDAEQEERAAVYNQLSKFAEMLKLDVSTCPRSKFLAMLQSAESEFGGVRLATEKQISSSNAVL